MCEQAHAHIVAPVTVSVCEVLALLSLTRATASSTATASSPASLVFPSSPSASQLPGNVTASQFLDMIRKEVRQHLAAHSDTTPFPSSPLSPTPTSVVPDPVLPVAASGSGLVWCGISVVHGNLLS